MKSEHNSVDDDTLQRIIEVLRRSGASKELSEEEALKEAAQEWIDAGFDDPEEIEEWLCARCFNAQSAQALEARGLTPAQASIRTTHGESGIEDTIGYKLTNGDLSFDEAQRIITNAFWNS